MEDVRFYSLDSLFSLRILFDIFNITFHFCYLKSKFWGGSPWKISFWMSRTSHENGPSNKAKLFTENISKNSNLDDSGISLPVSPSRTNLNRHISATPRTVKKVIINLDLSKTSGPDCIPVVVLKNCKPELSHILAEPFNKYLKESYFPDCWKV